MLNQQQPVMGTRRSARLGEAKKKMSTDNLESSASAIEIPEEDVDMLGPSITFVHEEELNTLPDMYQFSFPADSNRLMQPNDFIDDTDDDINDELEDGADDDMSDNDLTEQINNMDLDEENEPELVSIAPDSDTIATAQSC
ncbi:hypothetical protein BJV82DRAFT_577248 [Fennellomyces sp. T-0311]|nr:hypothetical protein BJV82DRAFT_577248 [Fennellomyces sp. T-0311]